MVNDVDQCIAFYCELLGFSLKQQYGAAMAIVESGDLQLWLAGPAASAAKPMPDGAQPIPGGWARVVLPVEDIEASVTTLRAAGATFRNELLAGPGGQQILCEDPSGNLVELFQPAS